MSYHNGWDVGVWADSWFQSLGVIFSIAMGGSNEPIQISTVFDYSSLDQAHRSIVKQHTGEIRKRLRRSAQDVWEIGQRLADVRSRLKYGQFLAWLKVEFGWSQRTAYNFINVYETFGDRFANLAKVDIATSVLYQLAAPSVPEELRTQVLKSAATGERVTNKAIKSAIKQSKQPQTITSAPSPQESSTPKPEIITIIPKVVEAAEPPSEPIAPSVITVTSGWYRLNARHVVFCGDTASKTFVEAAPQAKLAIAATNQDWAHDWLVDQADNMVVMSEEEFMLDTLEQLLNLLSSSGDTVIFPWLPVPRMLSVGHNLDRILYAGDANPRRCQTAIAASGLQPERIADGLTATLAG
ncbi:MAG: DUF3102 domain-containing protein [Cyanobacteria bacterium J06636_16]